MDEIKKADQVKRELDEIYRRMIRQNQASFFGQSKAEMRSAVNPTAKTNVKPFVAEETKDANDFVLPLVEAA